MAVSNYKKERMKSMVYTFQGSTLEYTTIHDHVDLEVTMDDDPLLYPNSEGT